MADYLVRCASCGKSYNSIQFQACPRCAPALNESGDLFDATQAPTQADAHKSFAAAFLGGRKKEKT